MRETIEHSLEKVDHNLASRLVDRYLEMRSLESLARWEDCLEKAGKFAEEVYRFASKAVLSVEISEVPDMEQLRKRIENGGAASPESLRVLVPRITQRAIWDLRSKRGGGHIKPIDANRLDCKLAVDAASWVLAELVRLYSPSGDPETALAVVDQLMGVRVPGVEEFDGEAFVADRGATLGDQILMALAAAYPQRVSDDRLIDATKPQNVGSFHAALARLERERGHVHRNAQGCRITTKGLKYVVEQLGSRSEEPKAGGEL